MTGTPAYVLGGTDLVRPLALGGIRSVAIVPSDDPVRHSRSVVATLDRERPDAELVDDLVRAARSHRERPVLFFGTDRDLLLVSRNREALSPSFRFVIAPAPLVEALTDKERFHALARHLGLPVPVTAFLRAGDADGALASLEPPLIVKPTRTTGGWRAAVGAKAARVCDPADLTRIRAVLAELGIDAVAQQFVEGPESKVESYHAYVDDHGETAGEFTGRKVRTLPPRYGLSTAVQTTRADDVAAAGRATVAALELRGVVKLDFKRDPGGALWLLEANPRFNLWHHPGAVAGVNIPALVHADLTGRPRRGTGLARAGVCWCDPLSDPAAAREHGISPAAWSMWALRCEARSYTSLDDPAPFLRDVLWPRVRKRWRAATAVATRR